MLSSSGFLGLCNLIATDVAKSARVILDHLMMPFVEVGDVTPVSLSAGWLDINYPVDSWTVSIREVLHGSSPETVERDATELLQVKTK